MKKELLKDLAALETESIISAQTASDIRNWYQKKEDKSPGRLGILLGILGAVLAGSGILLIIAHNWDELNKITKTIFAFLPLVLAQSLGAYTLLKKNDDRGWRECSAVFIFLAIPASIALISQIYQVDGSLESFLFTWILLALPLVYILNSSVVVLLCIALATWWAALTGYYDYPIETPYWYLLMMAFMAPHYYQLMRSNRHGNLLLLFNLFAGISITITLGSFLVGNENLYPFIFAIYLNLFCIFYLVGLLPEEAGKASRPFYLLGIVGILVILFTWSFIWFWKDFQYNNVLNYIFLTPVPYVLLVSLLVLTWILRKKQIPLASIRNHPIGFSFIIFLWSIFFFFRLPDLGMLFINGWILCIAISYIRRGSRENNFGILNFGLLILTILALCRYFDDSISFMWRGIFFLLTGISFFVANYLLIKKRKSLTTTEIK